MPVRMHRKISDDLPEDNQVFARGWQDYMLASRLFLGDEAVGDYFQGYSRKQRKRLGLASRHHAANARRR